MELKTYKQRVRKILEENIKARNNDGTLMAYYLVTFHKNLLSKDENNEWTIQLNNLKKLPPMENLRRSRQLIQNGGNMFLPTDPEVRKARQIKEENWKNAEVREANET